MRRFTTVAPDGSRAEGIQFTSGAIILDWDRANDRLAAFIHLDNYRNDYPLDTITWIDRDHLAADLDEWQWHLRLALETAANSSGRDRILIARDAGISQEYLGQVLLGQAAVSLPTASRIADACGHYLSIRVNQEGTTP